MFIPASIWCTTATRDSWSTTSKSLPAPIPAQIALRFQGQEKARLDGGGNLILASGGGEVRLKAPRIYQQFGAEQRPVAGRFALREDGKVGFELGSL